MKHILTFLLFFLFATILEAAYVRTINVSSVGSKKAVERELGELKRFVEANKTLRQLQKKHDFELQFRKTGKYYLLFLGPIKNRQDVQTILDTLRKSYKGVYVTKFKIPKKEIIKKVKIEKVLIPEVKEVALEENIIPVVEVTRAIDEKNVEKTLKTEKVEEIVEETQEVEEVVETTEVKSVMTVKEEYQQKVLLDKKKQALNNLENSKDVDNFINHKESYLWQILFVVTLLAFLVCLKKLLAYKKEKEDYVNRDIVNNEKIQEMTEEINNKDIFLSHASHELRSPMNAIMGLTHLVLEGELPNSQIDYVKRIEKSTDNLLSTVNDIVDISKIQAGELEVEKHEFNINDTIDYVLTIILMQANSSNTKISLDIDNSVPSRIMGDSLRLSQILINILSHAITFTKNGKVVLGLKQITSVAETFRLEFTVSDNGIGMSPEETENIFEFQSQEESSTGKKFSGSSLGLSISKKLVEVMDGEISVATTKGEGTVFTFNLLFSVRDSLNKRQYRLPSASYLDKKILIVDSSEENVNALTKNLEYFNYETLSIPSFEAALVEDEKEFDFIIVHHSNLNSSSIRKLKEYQSKNTKIVIMNELYKTVRDNFFQGLNIDACLKTPFTQQNILNMIIELYASKNLDNKSMITDPKAKLKKLRAKKILVAEDNELNHKVIAGLLEDTGIELTFVHDGQEAVDLVKKGKKIDLILMDTNMPNLNGYEASEEIRKDSQNNNIHILALTADVMESSIEKTFASGMQGHIAKPIILDMFYHKVYQALSSKDDIINIMSISRPNEYSNKGEFEELSVSSGLARSNNDVEFYKSILLDFKAMYMNSPSVLEQLAKDSYFKEARSLAIDVKDIALKVGAYNLCESAAAIEYEFEKAPESNWSQLISAYRISLERLFKDVDKYLKKI